MATAVESKRDRRRKQWRWSAYLTGAFFLLLLSLPPADVRDEGGSVALGYVFGRLVIVLGIALLLRVIYVKLIRRDGRPIVSPWLFAIAVPLALVLAAGRAAGDA